MKSIFTIKSGRRNAMFCLYHIFDEYTSYGVFEKTVHISNLSTTYEKAVAKAKALFDMYKDDNSSLVIGKEWELNEFLKRGEKDKKSAPIFEPVAEHQIEYPSSQKVGIEGELKTLTLGVTDCFAFNGRFGRSLCTKFVDVNHNVYVSFSNSKLMWELKVGDTLHCNAQIKGHKKVHEDYDNFYFETFLTKIKAVI